jgi:hypothetical protein
MATGMEESRTLITSDETAHCLSESRFVFELIEKNCALRGITVEQWCEEYGKRAYALYERWKGPKSDEPESLV